VAQHHRSVPSPGHRPAGSGGLTQQHLDIQAGRALLADVTGDGIVDLITTEAGGLRHVRTNRVVRAITLGYFGIVAFNGIDDVALVFLATDTLGGGQSAAGLLLAAVGIGLFLGYALLSWSKPPLPMIPLLLSGFAVSSAGNLLTGLAWAVAAAFTVQTIRGLGIAAMDVAANTVVQRAVPPDLLGRVFGTLYGAIGVAAALSYILGGLLLDLTSPRLVFLAAGLGGLLTTAATAAALQRPIGLRPPDPTPGNAIE
jgi:MFS family permease